LINDGKAKMSTEEQKQDVIEDKHAGEAAPVDADASILPIAPATDMQSDPSAADAAVAEAGLSSSTETTVEPVSDLAADTVVGVADTSALCTDQIESADVPCTKTVGVVSQKRKKLRLHEITAERDIRFRGPLSYRHLRMFAWLFLAVAQVGILLSFAAQKDDGFALQVGIWPAVLTSFNSVMMPLFLIAAFATILNNTRKYSSLILAYGGATGLIYLLFLLLHDRYAVGLSLAAGVAETRAEATTILDGFIRTMASGGFVAFNIFVDLLLCTLFTCFLVYRPKRFFVGKKLIYFRLLAILPALYEVGSIVCKILASLQIIVLPTYVFPLLTTKPPMTFVVFVVLAFFIKKREHIFLKRGKTHEEYDAFLKTNVNSLHFSIFTSIVLFVAVLLDLILFFVLSSALSGYFPAETAEQASSLATDMVMKWGFSRSVPLLFVIPFVMLFSYTRTYKDTRLDLIVPVLGLILFVLVYLEGFYQLARFYMGSM